MVSGLFDSSAQRLRSGLVRIEVDIGFLAGKIDARTGARNGGQRLFHAPGASGTGHAFNRKLDRLETVPDVGERRHSFVHHRCPGSPWRETAHVYACTESIVA